MSALPSFPDFDRDALVGQGVADFLDGFEMGLVDAQLVEVDDGHRLVGPFRLGFDGVEDHADGRGIVGDRVDQDEGARLLVRFVGVEEEFPAGGDAYLTDLVQLQMVGVEMFHRVHVDAVFDGLDLGAGRMGRLLDVELLGAIHRLLVHPDEHRLEVAALAGQVVGMDQHLAPRDVDLVLEREGDAERWEGFLQLAVVGHDAFHSRGLARGQGHYRVSLAHHAARHLSREAPEVLVRPQDVLDRIAQVRVIPIQVDGHVFQEAEQGRPGIPRRTRALLHHVVAIERRERDAHHVADAQRSDKAHVLVDDRVEHLPVEVHEIHLIDRQDHMMDAEEGYQVSMPPRLGDDARSGVDQDDRQVGRRAAGDHVAGILLVPGGVGDDELAVVGREIAIGHVDGDALLALGFQAIEQKGVIDVVARVAHPLAVALQGVQLVLINLLAIEKKSANQGRLAVIDGASREETEQILLFVFIQKSLYI